MLFSLQCLLNLRSQLRENTIIGSRIVLTVFTFIEQRHIYQRHQRNSVLALLTLISLRISIITVCDELGCLTVELFIGTVDRHLDLLIVDVQPYM